MKPIQVVYLLKNRLIKAPSYNSYKYSLKQSPKALSLIPNLTNTSATCDGAFTFLNLSAVFPETIDWNYSVHGKLWNYNLQYLDFIQQEDINVDIRLGWIKQIYSVLYSGSLKPEPYPASVRGINVIRFFSSNPTLIAQNPELQSALYAELSYLHDHYEYHLLGNHVLENGFSMLMGGYYFHNTGWIKKAEKVLREQLNEQILNDGAHFELSPMYHRIILFRLLEAISYVDPFTELNTFFRTKAEKMLGWITKMSFSNGDTPHFNDSADGISLSANELLKLAHILKLEKRDIKLSDSGYRKLINEKIEVIADVHGISPTYQPGHAHADHLSFVLYVHGKPFIVDTGTSTYSISERRSWERSSLAHNTVTVNSMNQSEVWSSFRVGQRAKVNIIEDRENLVRASVKYPGVSHTRTFIVESSSLIIEDEVKAIGYAALRLYLHPSVVIKQQQNSEIQFESGEIICFEKSSQMQISEYDFALAFNKLVKSKYIEVFFKSICKTFIYTG